MDQTSATNAEKRFTISTALIQTVKVVFSIGRTPPLQKKTEAAFLSLCTLHSFCKLNEMLRHTWTFPQSPLFTLVKRTILTDASKRMTKAQHA